MATAIVVYSLTGNTRTVATAVAAGLDATVLTLAAPGVRPGFGSMFWLGLRTFLFPRTATHLDQPLPEGLDLVVLAAPVWAGRLAFPMRVWLQSAPRLPARRALIMTGGAPEVSARALDEFSRLAGGEILARLYVDEASVKSGPPRAQIDSFCRSVAPAGLGRP